MRQVDTNEGGAVSRCRFCDSPSVGPAFARDGRRFFRCRSCRAYLQTIDGAPAEVAEEDVYVEGDFAERIEQETGDALDTKKFTEFAWCLRPGNLLEIGPGTGHYLAAAREAGFSVSGIEISRSHRDYMRRHWGIETAAAPLEANELAAGTIDNIVSFNCIEHVPDPAAHFVAAARVLKPGGRFVISTCNADSLLARWAGRYWAMFRPPDHLGIPSPDSLRAAAEAAGLRVVRLWCSEYPLATPIGLVVAARDWLAERRGRPAAGGGESEDAAAPAGPSRGRGLVHRLNRMHWAFGWLRAITSRYMVAGSVKGLFEKP